MLTHDRNLECVQALSRLSLHTGFDADPRLLHSDLVEKIHQNLYVIGSFYIARQ